MSNNLYELSDATDLTSCGGKATALAKVIGAGFCVPNGFVITAESNVPPSLILSECAKLDTSCLAVRSSATMEDGMNESWAGQLETFLNVAPNDVPAKVKLCQQSTNSVRAKAYGKNKTTERQTAVIVQEMIPAEISGVAFSVHPVTKDESSLIIESVIGLGEALVSGVVTPDTYVVNKHTTSPTSVSVGKQTKKLVLKSGVNTWQAFEASDQQNLSSDDIQKLSCLIIDLETFFGYGVDVEWAKWQGTFYVLQCRPITTLG